MRFKRQAIEEAEDELSDEAAKDHNDVISKSINDLNYKLKY